MIPAGKFSLLTEELWEVWFFAPFLFYFQNTFLLYTYTPDCNKRNSLTGLTKQGKANPFAGSEVWWACQRVSISLRALMPVTVHPAVDLEAPPASPAWSLPPVYCCWSTPRRHQGKALCFPRGCRLCNTDTEMLLEMEPINEQAWNQAPGCRKLPIWHLLVLGCPRTSTSNPNMRQLMNWQMWAENRRRMQHRESSSKKALFSLLSCPVTRKSTSVQKSKYLCWNAPLFTDPEVVPWVFWLYEN